MEDLRLKYRPQEMNEVWGNKHLKMLWNGFLKGNGIPKSIILYGNYGTGKTTVARIFARDIFESVVDWEHWSGNKNFIEIGSAKCGYETIKHTIYSVSNTSCTFTIFLDEAQRVADRSQDIFLKAIEDVPNLYFIFATTDIDKIDRGIISRSTSIRLVNPESLELFEKLKIIADKENIRVTDEALNYLIEFSKFNPRRCLGNLNTFKVLEREVSYQEAQDIFKNCTA